jgi:hypothetical protein
MIFYTLISNMIHWIPSKLSESEQDSVNEILQEQPSISGGGGGYELIDGDGEVLETIATNNFKDAGVHFINTTWPTNTVQKAYSPGVPVSVRNAVVDAVERGYLCTCAGTCSDPECDTRAFAWAHDYVQAYENKSVSGPPPQVRVRYNGEVRTFTPTFNMTTMPSPDEVRDGVIGKLRVKIT